MRKAYTIIIVTFLIFSSLLLVFFDKNHLDYLSILTISEERQRLITEDEEITITFYISSNDSFVTDASLVTGMYLLNDKEQIEVGLSEIRDLDYQEEFQSVDYYGYCYDINFKELNIDNYYMKLDNAILVVNYQNGESLRLEIGNMYLNFKDIDNPEHIDMTRMFTTYYPNTNVMSGLVIGLDNMTGFQVTIDDIFIGNESVDLDLENSIKLTEVPEYNTDIDSILGYEYQGIGEVDNQTSINLLADDLIFIPFKYHNEYKMLDRFPVVMDYTYNNQEEQYLIDDFMFNTQNLGLELNNGRIREFIYYY